MKLSFSDATGLKLVPLLNYESLYTESLYAIILEMHLLKSSPKRSHIKV